MDERDQVLAKRLRAYEARIPDEDAPTPGTSRPRRRIRWPVLIAGGVTTAVVGGALALVMLNAPDLGVGRSTSSQSGSTPTAVSATPTPAPPGSAEPSAVSPAPITEGWTLAESFSSPDESRFVFDVTAWSGGFAAVGLRMDGMASDVGPYSGQPTIWLSADGADWEERDLGVSPQGDDQRVEHIVPLPDGRLLLLRSSYDVPQEAWVSADAITWEPVELGLTGTLVRDLEHGPLGFVLIGRTASETEQIWYSADGVGWELTRELPAGDGSPQLERVGAGPEGFVIAGARRGEADRALVLASGDGRTWFEAPEQGSFQDGDFPYDVAPLGNDWVATGFGAEASERRPVVWLSPDGLDWTRHAGPIDPSGRTAYYATDIAGAGGHVVISPAVEALSGPFPYPTTAWSSRDGLTWDAIGPEESYVTELVAAGDTVIAAGRIGRGTGAAFWRSSVVRGASWELHDVPDGHLNGLLGDEHWIATGPNQVLTSVDGATWTAAEVEAPPRGAEGNPDFPGFVPGPREAARLGASLFAVGGWQGYGDDLHPVVWRSVDGSSWDELSEASLDGYAMLGLASNGRTLVAAQSDYALGSGSVWSSTDGLSWTEATGPAGRAAMFDVWGDTDGFVAVGWRSDRGSGLPDDSEPVAWTSLDGIVWEEAHMEPGVAGQLFSVTRGPAGGYAALGVSGNADAPHLEVWTSVDGRTWTGGGELAAADGIERWWWPAAGVVTAAGALHVVASADGSLLSWRSVDDGATWIAGESVRVNAGPLSLTAVGSNGTDVIALATLALPDLPVGGGPNYAWVRRGGS